MHSLRILYDVDGWAFHHVARALQRHAPADFDRELLLAGAVRVGKTRLIDNIRVPRGGGR